MKKNNNKTHFQFRFGDISRCVELLERVKSVPNAIRDVFQQVSHYFLSLLIGFFWYQRWLPVYVLRALWKLKNETFLSISANRCLLNSFFFVRLWSKKKHTQQPRTVRSLHVGRCAIWALFFYLFSRILLDPRSHHISAKKNQIMPPITPALPYCTSNAASHAGIVQFSFVYAQ